MARPLRRVVFRNRSQVCIGSASLFTTVMAPNTRLTAARCRSTRSLHPKVVAQPSSASGSIHHAQVTFSITTSSTSGGELAAIAPVTSTVFTQLVPNSEAAVSCQAVTGPEHHLFAGAYTAARTSYGETRRGRRTAPFCYSAPGVYVSPFPDPLSPDQDAESPALPVSLILNT